MDEIHNTSKAYAADLPTMPADSQLSRGAFLHSLGAAAALASGALSLEPVSTTAALEAAALGPLQGHFRRQRATKLRDQRLLCNENFNGFTFTRFNGKSITV